MPRQVKGVLFADYVRMIRSHKGVDWALHLPVDDVAFLKARIEPNGWYPMATFERLGNAILSEIANGDLQAVRMWGQFSVDALCHAYPTLLAVDDPVESFMRFRVLRATFFDFEALEIPTLTDGHAEILIDYQMGARAEEAAAHQTMGFFEHLLVLAGCKEVDARFVERRWAGDLRTRLALDWTT